MAPVAWAEHCINWQPWLSKHTGTFGHCWATQQECQAYYVSRCLNPTYAKDCAGGCYQRGGPSPQQQADAAAAAAGKAKAAAEAAKKLAAQKQAQQASEQQAWNAANKNLIEGLKGVPAPAASPALRLKLPAPTAARQQLDCASRQAASVKDPEDQPSWEQRAEDCRPTDVAVPEVPEPVEVSQPVLPTDPAALAQLLAALSSQLAASREVLARHDGEIAKLEQAIAHEQSAASPAGFKPASESDALRKAREALARARAEREKTAAELRRLEQLEAQAGKSPQAPAQPAPAG